MTTKKRSASSGSERRMPRRASRKKVAPVLEIVPVQVQTVLVKPQGISIPALLLPGCLLALAAALLGQGHLAAGLITLAAALLAVPVLAKLSGKEASKPVGVGVLIAAGLGLTALGWMILIQPEWLAKLFGREALQGFLGNAGISPGLVLGSLGALVFFLASWAPMSAPKLTRLCLGFGATALYWLWSMAVISSSAVKVHGQVFHVLFDDAMISMRYAWNLAHGNGLVWNLGERVEGFTNLLTTLGMAIPCRLMEKPVASLPVQVAGAMFIIMAAWACMGLSRRLFAFLPEGWSTPLGLLCFITPLAYYPLNYWSLMGMETGMFGMLLCLSVWWAFERGDKPGPAPLFLLLLAALALCRPDAMLPAGLLLLYRAWRMRSAGFLGLIGSVGVEALFLAAVMGGLTAWRISYYGDPFPNTYYLKLTGWPLGVRLVDGVHYIKPYLVSAWPVLALAALALLLQPSAELLLILALAVSAAAYQVYAGGEAWPYWRQMAPSFPLLLAAALLGTLRLLDLVVPIFSADLSPAALRSGLLILIWGGAFLWADYRFLPEMSLAARPYTVEYNGQNVGKALDIARLTKPDALVACYWAGVVPFFSGRPSLDLYGKCDRHIAHLPAMDGIGFNGMRYVPGHNKIDHSYSIWVKKPDVACSGFIGLDQYMGPGYGFLLDAWWRFDSPRVDWNGLCGW